MPAPVMETLTHGRSETGRASPSRLSNGPRLLQGAAWALVVVAQLVLIWAFPRVPTQDGPVHVASAIAFRDLGEPGTSHATLFDRRLEPFPNWTSHLLLGAMTRVLDPAVAEKLLVSLWFVLWPLGAWRLAGAFGADRSTVTGTAVLLSFGRAFWLGFYNFLLGMALALLVVAWVETTRGRRAVRDAVIVSALFLLLFFTHLGAWLLAAVLVVALASVSPDRSQRLLPLLGALGPSLALVLVFAFRAGVQQSSGIRRALQGLTGPSGGPVSSLGLEWFGAHAASWATVLALATLAILGAVVLGAFVGAERSRGGEAQRRVLLAVGAGAAVAFLLGPDDLGAHAGYFKARLALVAPVLVLAGLATIGRKPLRRNALIGLLLLNIWSLWCAASFLAGANRDLAEFTAASDVVGRGKTLVLLSEEGDDSAVDYINPNLYCLGTGNSVATNYQAGTRHFPLQYRPGVRKAAREMTSRTRPVWTDVALLWDVAAPRPRGLTHDYAEAYRRGRLRVFTRREATPDGALPASQ